MSLIRLGYVKLSENAYPPQRATSHAAGYDLRSAYDYIVLKQNRTLVKTDLGLEIPEVCYGRIAPRSGLALNHFISVGAGVIDRDYTGNVSVLLFNHSQSDFYIKKGDKIAQLILEMIVCPQVVELSSLSQTERGDQGFGSTGIV